MPQRTCLFPIRVELRGVPTADTLSQMSEALAQTVSDRLADAAIALAGRGGGDYREVHAQPSVRFSGQPIDAGLQRQIATALEAGVARALSSFPARTAGASAPAPQPAPQTAPSPPQPQPPPPAPPPPPPPPLPSLPPPAPAPAPPRIPLTPERSRTSFRLNGVLMFAIEPLPGQEADAATVTFQSKFADLEDGRSRLEITVERPRDVAVRLLPGALPALAHLASEISVREVVVRPPPRALFHVPDAYELQELLARDRGEVLLPMARPPEQPRSSEDDPDASPGGGPATAPGAPDQDAETPPAPGVEAQSRQDDDELSDDPPAAADDGVVERIRGDTRERIQTNVFEARTLLTGDEHLAALRRLLRGEGLILPYRKRALAAAAALPIRATRLPGALIGVQLPADPLSGALAGDRELRFPRSIAEGVVLRETDLVGVKLFDDGGEVVFMPALMLPQLADEDTRAALIRISRADRAAALLLIANARLQAERAWLVQAWPEEGAALAAAIELLVVQPPSTATRARRDAQRASELRRCFEAWRARAKDETPSLPDDRREGVWALEQDVQALVDALVALARRSRRRG